MPKKEISKMIFQSWDMHGQALLLFFKWKNSTPQARYDVSRLIWSFAATPSLHLECHKPWLHPQLHVDNALKIPHSHSLAIPTPALTTTSPPLDSAHGGPQGGMKLKGLFLESFGCTRRTVQWPEHLRGTVHHSGTPLGCIRAFSTARMIVVGVLHQLELVLASGNHWLVQKSGFRVCLRNRWAMGLGIWGLKVSFEAAISLQ
jgi:hypothetical protein